MDEYDNQPEFTDMKIIQANLTEAQIEFMREELSRTCAAAIRAGKIVPSLKITLEARCCDPVKPDHSPFPVYAQRKREEQRYSLEKSASAVSIRGGGYPGVLYGLYALLRRELGADWTGLNDEDIVFHRHPAPEKNEVTPAVPFRGVESSPTDQNLEFFAKFMRYLARNQWNMLQLNATRWADCPRQQEFAELGALCAIELHIGGHAIEMFLDDAVFEQHPEYFGFRDGHRCLKGAVEIPDLNLTIPQARIQSCYSNPEACRHMAQNIAAYLEKHPECPVFSLWPHDGANNWCQCPECLKITPYEQMLLLGQQVLELAPRPIYLEVLAYCSLLTLPKKPANLERVYTIFCPYLRFYDHLFFEPRPAEPKQRLGFSYPAPDPVCPDDDRDYGVLLNDWLEYLKDNRGTLGIFAYYQLLFFDEKNRRDRTRYLRFPDPAIVAAELRNFIDSGMLVYYDCSPPYPNVWPDARLYSFYSRLLIDPATDENRLIANRKEELLGAAAPIIDSITATLDRDVREWDPALTGQLAEACRNLPPDRAKRLKLWLEYVLLGSASCRAAEQHDVAAVEKFENEIIQLFEDNRELLQDYTSIEGMIRYATRSRTISANLSNILA